MDKCIKCGKEAEIDIFCKDCFVPFIKTPKKFLVKQCKYCLIYLVEDKKVFNKEDVEEILKKRIKGNFKEIYVDFDEKKAIVVLEGKHGDIEYSLPLSLVVEKILCEECLKKKSGYYEGIVQIRGDKDKQQKFANFIIKNLNKKTFITKIENLKEGIDIYVGSSKSLLETLQNIGIKKYKISSKLHTVKMGKRIYRITVSIRL